MKAIDYLRAVELIKNFDNDLYRFLEKVVIDNNTGCWNWIGAVQKFGYGRIKWNGSFCSSHRVSYSLFRGDIGDLFVCHHCDNPKCVNPDHLFLGTNSDNMKDAYDKGRLNLPTKSRFKKGHKSLNAAISEDIVKEIKIELEKNELSMVRIANKFSVKYQAVRDIKSKRSYINV